MLLKDWLKKKKMTPYKLSKHFLKCSHSTVTEYLAGRSNLSKKYAVKIEELTDGEVTRTEVLWPEDFPTKKEDLEQIIIFPKKGEHMTVFPSGEHDPR